MQLAEHFVEQVSQGGAVSVAAVSAAAVVLAGGAGVDAGIGGPDPADGGEAVVFDPTVGDGGDLARGPGDGRRPCIGLQRTVVGESRTVIADLGQDTGTGQLGQAGKTGDDRVVGVSAEFVGSSLCEVVGAGAGGIEHRQQDKGLAAHRFFDKLGLTQLRGLQMLENVDSEAVDAAFAAGAAQRGGDAGLGEFGRVRRSGAESPWEMWRLLTL